MQCRITPCDSPATHNPPRVRQPKIATTSAFAGINGEQRRHIFYQRRVAVDSAFTKTVRGCEDSHIKPSERNVANLYMTERDLFMKVKPRLLPVFCLHAALACAKDVTIVATNDLHACGAL